MKRQRRLFGLLLLWHLGLTIGTGLGWTALMMALGSHRTPALLDATYASFSLFVPFCQPFFWPLSDWVARSGYFNFFNSSWPMELMEYLIIACLNSLTASILLLGFARILKIAQSRRRQLPLEA